MGYLTALLQSSWQKQGYELTEDEDFIYILYGGKTVATFNARATDLATINEWITEREIQRLWEK